MGKSVTSTLVAGTDCVSQNPPATTCATSHELDPSGSIKPKLQRAQHLDTAVLLHMTTDLAICIERQRSFIARSL